MGTTYSHGIFVQDLRWQATWQHVEAVTRVLTRWGFTLGEQAYNDLADSETTPIERGEAEAMPANLMVVFDGPEGAPAARLMGPSMYDDVDDDDRYVISGSLVVGSDLKVLAGIEGNEVDIEVPPLIDGEEVEPLEFHSAYPAITVVYPATYQSTPPRTSGDARFDRVWRAGLILDCDKDVPAIAETGAGLPATELLRELEAAFGTALVELGWES